MIFYHDPRAQIADSAGAVFKDANALRDFVRQHKQVPPLSIVRTGDVEPLAALALQIGDVTLVLDEMDRATKDKKWTSESVKKIVMEGRHHRVALFGTFRRTTNVSEDLVSQTDYVFLFRHSKNSIYDLQNIERRFGPEYREAATKLERMQFAVWRDD